MAPAQALSPENEEEEETPEEADILYDVRDDLSDQDRVENLEDTPVPISITELRDVQKIDEFCKEVLSRKDRGTSLFVDTEYGVLRRVSLNDIKNL